MKNTIVQVIVATGCTHCHEFLEFWRTEHSLWPKLTLEEINILTPEGQRIAGIHHIFALPGIIVNGHVLSTGKVEVGELKNEFNKLFS